MNTRPLIDWLLLRFPNTPRTRAKQWLAAGRVTIDGQVVRKPHQPVPDPGDSLQLRCHHAVSLDCGSGWQIHPLVSLLFLDASFAILSKGAGVLSIPASVRDTSALGILADFLAGRLEARRRGYRGGAVPPAYRRLRPLPVHRLDQYTTGLFCVALNPVARRKLIEQVKAHSMTRQYLAFVEGHPPTQSGTWRHWLQLDDHQSRQRAVPEPGLRIKPGAGIQEAVTHFEIVAEYPLPRSAGFVTKLRLRLETGCKHQIRVQAAAAGLPLLGDRTYNPHYGPSAKPAPIPFARQALHSELLSLEHPEQPGEQMSWTAPLPPDLRQLQALLEHQAGSHPPPERANRKSLP